jgi:hypothetical protein
MRPVRHTWRRLYTKRYDCQEPPAGICDKVSSPAQLALTLSVTEDMVILGKRLPKGTTIVFSTLLGHEDRSTPIYAVPEYASESSSVQDPKSAVAVQLSNSLAKARTVGSERKVGYWAAGSGKKFDPDRWLDAEGRFDLTAGPSLPFSLGQRGCFGKNLAVSGGVAQS